MSGTTGYMVLGYAVAVVLLGGFFVASLLRLPRD